MFYRPIYIFVQLDISILLDSRTFWPTCLNFVRRSGKILSYDDAADDDPLGHASKICHNESRSVRDGVKEVRGRTRLIAFIPTYLRGLIYTPRYRRGI